MSTIPIIKEEPIVLLEEVLIQSEVDKRLHKQWTLEHIKNLPPLNVSSEARKAAQDKLQKIKLLKTNNKNNLS